VYLESRTHQLKTGDSRDKALKTSDILTKRGEKLSLPAQGMRSLLLIPRAGQHASNASTSCNYVHLVHCPIIMSSSIPTKHILTPIHLAAFQRSPTYRDLTTFIDELNESVIGLQLGDIKPSPVRSALIELTLAYTTTHRHSGSSTGYSPRDATRRQQAVTLWQPSFQDILRQGRRGVHLDASGTAPRRSDTRGGDVSQRVLGQPSEGRLWERNGVQLSVLDVSYRLDALIQAVSRQAQCCTTIRLSLPRPWCVLEIYSGHAISTVNILARTGRITWGMGIRRLPIPALPLGSWSTQR
jgi:hypothetical protein